MASQRGAGRAVTSSAAGSLQIGWGRRLRGLGWCLSSLERKQADFTVYSQGVRCRQRKVFSQSFWRSLLTAGEMFWMWESHVEMSSPCTLRAVLGRGLGLRELLLHQRAPCFSLRCPGWQGNDVLCPGPWATPCPRLTLLVS